MLTQEQTQQLRMEESLLEDAELQQAAAWKKAEKYSKAIESANNYLSDGSLSPDKMAKIQALIPELQKWYEDSMNAMYWAEDRYRQHLNNINNFKKLDAIQIATPQAWERRRTVGWWWGWYRWGWGGWNGWGWNWGGWNGWGWDRLSDEELRQIADQFFGPNNYYSNFSNQTPYWYWLYTNWSAYILPNGWVAFDESFKDPETFALWQKYNNAAKTWTGNWIRHLHYNMPNYFDFDKSESDRIRQAMLRDGLTTTQANAFMRDWEEAFTP